MRAVLGIVAGIVAGFAAMLVIAWIGELLFAGDLRIDTRNAEAIAAAFPGLPTGAKVAIVLSWFGGGLIGAAVAKRVLGRAWAAWTITAVIALLVLFNVLIVPMPSWLQAIAVLAPLLGGLIANHLVADREPAAPAPAANADF